MTRRGRVLTGLVAAATGAAVIAHVLVDAPGPVRLRTVVGVTVVVLLVGAAATGRAFPASVAVVLTVASALVRHLGAELEPVVVIHAAAIHLVADLAWAATASRVTSWPGPGVRARRGARRAALIGGGALAGVVVLALVRAGPVDGPLGLVAVVAVLVLLAGAGRVARTPGGDTGP